MSCTDVVTENCDDADLFVSLDTRDLEQADLIELVANATLRYTYYIHIYMDQSIYSAYTIDY